MTVSTGKVVSLIASKNLVSALKTAVGITSPYSRAALQHLHLQFFGDDITVEATSLDLYFRQNVSIPELGVSEPFSVMVHRDAVKTLKPGMDVTFGESSYTFGGIKYTPSSFPSDFPQFPELDDSKFEVTTDRGYFAELSACAVSASESELRPILRGVCHRGNTLAATDSLRLCLSSSVITQWPKEIVVPGWAGTMLQRAFGDSSTYMAYDDRYVQYIGNGHQIIIRAIEGTYPDVSRIMPSMFKTTVTVRGAEEWIAACDRAITVHKQIPKKDRDENYTTVLHFDTSGITLTVQKEQEFRAQLPGEFSGEPVTIACNAQYLRDALVQTGNGAEAHFNEEKQPFLLVSSSESMYERKALVSPVFMKRGAGSDVT